MRKSSITIVLMLNSLVFGIMAGPVAVEKSSSDDLSTSETFGYGYYQPHVYSTPFIAAGVPLGTTAAIAPPIPAATTIGSASGGYGRSGFGYGSGYKYGSGYDFGKRWDYGTGSGVNEFYRRHPVYVAYG